MQCCFLFHAWLSGEVSTVMSEKVWRTSWEWPFRKQFWQCCAKRSCLDNFLSVVNSQSEIYYVEEYCLKKRINITYWNSYTALDKNYSKIHFHGKAVLVSFNCVTGNLDLFRALVQTPDWELVWGVTNHWASFHVWHRPDVKPKCFNLVDHFLSGNSFYCT